MMLLFTKKTNSTSQLNLQPPLESQFDSQRTCATQFDSQLVQASQSHSQPTPVVEPKFDFDSEQEEDEETEMQQSQPVALKRTWIVDVIGKHLISSIKTVNFAHLGFWSQYLYN